MRAAIYYTPPAGDPLTGAAAQWLGRDAFTGETYPPMGGEGLAAAELRDLTSGPRRYGFHATLKAPFRLADGRRLEDLEAALAGFCAANTPIVIGHFEIASVDRFVALVPGEDKSGIGRFAQAIVEAFDAFRAPPREDELARLRAAGLNSGEEANLLRWGYPYVGDAFRFHMTLSDGIDGREREAVINLLRRRFNGFLDEPFVLDALALFVEAEPGADFVVHSRHILERAP